MNDLHKIRLQETGETRPFGPMGITVWELTDIVESLGLDPRSTWVRDGRLVVADERRIG